MPIDQFFYAHGILAEDTLHDLVLANHKDASPSWKTTLRKKWSGAEAQMIGKKPKLGQPTYLRSLVANK